MGRRHELSIAKSLRNLRANSGLVFDFYNRHIADAIAIYAAIECGTSKALDLGYAEISRGRLIGMDARYYAVDADSAVVNEAEATMGKPVEVMVDLEYGLSRMQLLNALVSITDHISRNQPARVPVTAPPVNRDVPYVGGSGTVGSTLTCTMGNWTGEPSSYAYKWLRDDNEEVGTGQGYIVVVADRGTSLTCVVTATNALGSTDAPPSNAVAVP